MSRTPKLVAERLPSFICGFCTGRDVNPTTRTCRDCQTTMPGVWGEVAPWRSPVEHVPNATAIAIVQVAYHGPGRDVWENSR
jgi:hypothetical protein